MTAEKKPSIDKKVLEKLENLQAPGEPDIILELIDVFLASSSERLDALKEHLTQKNLTAVARDAHSLKSGARTIGAMTLGDLCEELEKLKAAAQSDHAKRLADKIEYESTRAQNELKKLRQIQSDKKR